MQTLPSLLSIIGNESVRKIRSAADVTDSSYRQCSGTETRYRPRGGGAARRYAPPADGSLIQKSRRIYIRPRTGLQSTHLWWPAVAELQAASVPIAM